MEQPQPEDLQPENHRPSDADVSLARTFGSSSLLREIIETVLLAVILFLILNTATGRFEVRGSSMEPTLEDGQYLIVSKISYWVYPPQRGDIIVLHPPNSPSEDYVKRVVGLPGETVKIEGDVVWIDGIRLDEPYIVAPGFYAGAWVLGEDEYFVLGDNRVNSSDSHTWGALPKESIIGKAWLCYWPPEAWKRVPHHAFSDLMQEGQ